MNTKYIKKLVLKFIVIIIIFLLYAFIQAVCGPILTNEVAINQLNSSTDSYVMWSAYKYFWNLGWAILVIIALIAFRRDIIRFIKFITEKIENKEEER